MGLDNHGHNYPAQETRVEPFDREFWKLFAQPPGMVEGVWPPEQLNYLGDYLNELHCLTIVVETHYIDRDYVSDVSLFYSRSLRSYPNYCQRLHFFDAKFDHARWKEIVVARGASREASASFLRNAYLGFAVVRPLPGVPVGRTVLKTYTAKPANPNHRRFFGAVREYIAHLAGFELPVRGLAFQQQDQGVSACATTALWSALHRVAPMESLPVPTPAEITEAAARYFLPGGRSLPSEGLTVHQICEATRAAGLAPMLIEGKSLGLDRAQLFAYICSGFAPVLAIQPVGAPEGHAICAVGLKLGDVEPQADPSVHFRDASTAVVGLYVHDDRLGPYARAELAAHTTQSGIVTSVRIQAELSILRAVIVPVPVKLRLSVIRMRTLGMAIAEATGHRLFPEFNGAVTLSCVYRVAPTYRNAAHQFNLTDPGLYRLACEIAMSRYIGVIEISGPSGPLFDIVLDATETRANPSALACVKREALPAGTETRIAAIATRLGAAFIA